MGRICSTYGEKRNTCKVWEEKCQKKLRRRRRRRWEDNTRTHLKNKGVKRLAGMWLRIGSNGRLSCTQS